MAIDEKGVNTQNASDHIQVQQLEHHDAGAEKDNPPIDLAAEELGEDFKWDRNVILNLLALYMTFWSTVWSYSIVPTSIAFIDKAFPTQSGITYWVASSPSLVQCVLSLFIGELSDIFGRRWFLIVADICMLVGNLVVGRGANAQTLIGGQVINGVGIALGFLVTPLLAECVPKRSRSWVIGLGGAMSGVITNVGAMAQGSAAQFNAGGLNQGWRVGAYIGAGFGAIALVLITIFYHPGRRPNPEHLTTKQRVLMIDWIGIVLGTAGLVIFLVGIDSGGNPYPWESARVIAMIVVGFVLLVVFGIWEWKGAKLGLFPRAVFKHRNFPVSLAAYFVEGMVINSSTAFLAQINLALFTTNQLLSLVRSLQLGLGTLVASVLGGWLLYKLKEAKWLLMASMLVSLIGVCLMIILEPHMNFAAFFFPVGLIGLSIGLVGLIVPIVASLCTPNEFIATAISLSTSARGLGGSIGVVITSQVFEAKLKVKLPAYAATAALKAGLPATSLDLLLYDALLGHPESIPTIPGITPAILDAFSEAVAQAYADSFRYIWYVIIPFNVLVLVFTLFLKSTKEQMTLEVASPVKNTQHKHHDKEMNELDVRA